MKYRVWTRCCLHVDSRPIRELFPDTETSSALGEVPQILTCVYDTQGHSDVSLSCLCLPRLGNFVYNVIFERPVTLALGEGTNTT